MKKLLGILVLGLLWCNIVLSETVAEKRTLYISNNLSAEFTECRQYYLIGIEAIKTHDPDSELINQYFNASKTAGEIAYALGVEAGMSDEAMLARSELLTDVMMKSINNNWANMSVLILKYAEFCKDLIENPEERNQYWINKAHEKYK